MSSFTSKTLLAAMAGAASVAAHGHITNIVINGVSYQTYDPTSFPYMSNPPTVVGWAAADTDNGFVDGSVYAAGDIICHKNGTNAGGHAVVAAGDSIFIQWDTWPESHKGPVLDYLANCGTAGCETVDKTTLEFFKIDEVGLIDYTESNGKWGSDELIANNNGWLVQIPSSIAPGYYVLRHEIIALHSAGSTNGAQNYPQCVNLQVTGSGSDSPAGTLGESLYTPEDAGILINIYTTLSTYDIPGPTLIAGATNVAQASSSIASSASAVVGSGTAAAAAATSATSAATSVSTKAAAVSSTTSVAAAAAATTAETTSTKATSAAAQTSVSRCGGSKKRSHARDVIVA